MAFSLFKQIFGDLEHASEEEKRLQAKNLVWVMFGVAVLGIIASFVLPYFYN